MQCPKCHGNIPDNSKFCTLCGAKIEAKPASGNVHFSNPSSLNAGGSAAPCSSGSSAPGSSPAAGTGSSFTAGDLAGKAGDVGKKLASNVDFHNLNPVGITTLMAVGWLIVFIGLFVDVMSGYGETMSFQRFASMAKEYSDGMVNLHFGLIAAIIFILAALGFFLALNPKGHDSRKMFAIFGIGSTIAAFLLTLIVCVITFAKNAVPIGAPDITLMGYLVGLVAIALLVLSYMELDQLSR